MHFLSIFAAMDVLSSQSGKKKIKLFPFYESRFFHIFIHFDHNMVLKQVPIRREATMYDCVLHPLVASIGKGIPEAENLHFKYSLFECGFR